MELFCCPSTAAFGEKPGLEIYSVSDGQFIQFLELSNIIKKVLLQKEL